jgi:hypothetical protein
VAFRSDAALRGSAEMVICDVSGRVVHRLRCAPGTNGAIAQWDGHDDTGRTVAPGFYSAMVIDGSRWSRVPIVRLR